MALRKLTSNVFHSAYESLTSNLSFYGSTPEVNFFPDDNAGAKGFTANMFPVGSSAKPSQFIGISGNTFTYPSRIVNRFNALNIQDNSYNTTYMPQPYIVRGMQRKNKANDKPQYWGFGSKSGFDDGLIRGGAVTVGDRIVSDVVRIGKFMASPKGLLWIVKQVGLGLTNPKVEVNPLAPIRQTRIHSGVMSLLSVAGSPLGLHFTTHGIPFVNEVASYENVQKAKKTAYQLSPLVNRLVSLRSELFGPLSLIQRPGMPIISLSGLAGPQSVYGIGVTDIKRQVDSRYLTGRSTWTSMDPYASGLRANTGYDFDSPPTLSISRNADKVDNSLFYSSLKKKITSYSDSQTPGNDTKADLSDDLGRIIAYVNAPIGNINSYVTLAYGKIPKSKAGSIIPYDFRTDLDLDNDESENIVGGTLNSLKDYYTNFNLDKKYGFGNQGKVGADRTNPYDFIVSGSQYNGTNRKILVNTTEFRGDKITALDIGNTSAVNHNGDKLAAGDKLATGLDYTDVYPTGVRDFIKFVFSDGDYGKNVIVFRATIKGLTDSFTPGWNKLTIIGRPDGAYLYESYERSISFTFTVAALSRAEMIPMWRKLNYLASYTMPNLIDSKNTFGKASGPMMRITIGDLFNATPGFLESLSYTIPDDATWDIAEDTDNPDAKQLPMMVEASVTFKIISDYRPQLMGRAYSLSKGGNQLDSTPGQWLVDSRDNPSNKTK